MSIRRGLMAQMANGKIPVFMNHLESGTVSLRSGTWIDIPSIAFPKGILVYSNDFDLQTNSKADKDKLGAYAALYIAGSDDLSAIRTTGDSYIISYGSFYYTNWGQNTNQQNPTSRSSRTETRGIPYFDYVNRRFYFYGFGEGDYDFKQDIEYHWLAWD
jgi:hypothetical protein